MDICLRKQLIATCSKNYIKIWNYNTRKLEQERRFDEAEETLAIAFHPSGYHLVVAFLDKILCMNVLSNSIIDFNLYQMKDCRELRFSNGGHLFAASTSTGSV
jgi:WD40 repeat protein